MKRFLIPLLLLAWPALAAPAITVNGGFSATVRPGAQITGAVPAGPGNQLDWVRIEFCR